MENLRTRTTYFFIGLNMIIFWSSCVFYHSMSLPEETALSGITIPFVVSSELVVVSRGITWNLVILVQATCRNLKWPKFLFEGRCIKLMFLRVISMILTLYLIKLHADLAGGLLGLIRGLVGVGQVTSLSRNNLQ